MNTRFMIKILVILFGMVICWPVWSASPCEEATALRRERMVFDVEMRRKRISLRQSVLDLKARDNALDKKMADIEDEILKTSDEKKADELWKQYDLIDEQRNALSPQIDEVQKKYYQASLERARGKLDMKYKRIVKRYECVVNEPLNKKLGAIANRSPSPLLDQRAEMIDSLKKTYELKMRAIDLKIKELGDLNSRLLDVAAQEDAVSSEKDRKYDEANSDMDTLKELIDKYGDELSELSKKIMTQIKQAK